ncbi:MAG: D-amino-acid transaminase, partial [Deltaproteobacteria bacterium]|nr:D-amino-acid transaminase [Deltaproteobacteria bacterium]
EVAIKVDSLKRYQEAFLTGSILEVAPLVTVDDTPIGEGKPGPITRKIQEAYQEMVLATANNF